MLTSGQLDTIEREFERIFGERPTGIHLIDSHAAGTADADSDIDLYLETDLPLDSLTKFTPAGFEFFKAINPGVVPNDVTGIGAGPTEAFLGERIPKTGTIDPFFGPSPKPPSRKLR